MPGVQPTVTAESVGIPLLGAVHTPGVPVGKVSEFVFSVLHMGSHGGGHFRFHSDACWRHGGWIDDIGCICVPSLLTVMRTGQA